MWLVGWAHNEAQEKPGAAWLFSMSSAQLLRPAAGVGPLGWGSVHTPSVETAGDVVMKAGRKSPFG